MKTTYSVTEGQARFPQLVKQAAGELVTIERHGSVAAYLVGRERMEAIAETMELLANTQFRSALNKYQAGKLKMKPFHV
jgi:PHD/YefM family antitoxin component YafN of YafNO toxin-antitoxin module